MRIPGLKTLTQTARWLRSRFVDGTLILGYHRVAEMSQDPYGLCVTPQHFAEQLQVLRQCAHPIGLGELVQGLEDRNLPKQAVALTIDDGYADSLYQAKPLLERYRTPATVFVTTGCLGREFWWDELERILFTPTKLPDQLCLSIGGDVFDWALDDTAENRRKRTVSDWKQSLLMSLYEQLLPLSSVEREKAMQKLKLWAGVDSDGQPHSRALTADELVELEAGELMEIGTHTMTHPLLSELPAAAQREEVEGSKAYLEALLEQPVTSFSYPNGRFSAETLIIVRDSGFVCACTSVNDVAGPGSNPFKLPRFWMPDWDGATFSRWLKWWIHS